MLDRIEMVQRISINTKNLSNVCRFGSLNNIIFELWAFLYK